MITRSLIILLCFIVLLYFIGHVCVNSRETFHLSDKEIKTLVAKAEAGDANAAYKIWTYHSMSSRNEIEADKWLRNAARLGHPEAQRWLAYEIKKGYKAPEDFGETACTAVESLLQAASNKSGTAADDLGEAYREGYLKPMNRLAKAREAFLLAAAHHNTNSWESLAEMFHKGEGGAPDQSEAYYYIVLSTQCIHADSITGKELWKLRKEIETQLTIDQMTAVWERVDAYIKAERKYQGGRLYPPALLGTGIPEKEWKKRLEETDKKESEHRKSLK